uniref:Uncharacterized protein n=1 Tax=Poecilia reticulata TaxID=8081 RepID=A0A3P9NCB1_POERE
CSNTLKWETFYYNTSNIFYLTFSPDDTVSASSNMDMEDRVSHLEQRLQLQEDEIQLLKAALADALRRLGYCEEQSQGPHAGGAHAGRRPLAAAASAPPTKGKNVPFLLTCYLISEMCNEKRLPVATSIQLN